MRLEPNSDDNVFGEEDQVSVELLLGLSDMLALADARAN